MTDQNAESIFGQAIEIPADEDRAAFLNEACGADQQLRAEVEKLVADHFRAGSFLEQPAINGDATAAMPPGMEQVGSRIGHYKLRERLGEGGMGVVWAAEQKQPLRRKVALKVIKPGMDSSQVIARFEAEREALALMDHPNIARVLDAGTTEQGRPYFVMELIRGVSITDYCDAKRLTIRQRLALFPQVCKAVQHAHQKGIIHRDIKPSNVLVTEQDGKPVPKVIDFGIAKALHQPLTELSIYTGIFQAVGTLAYMSPEQATLSAVDVDTRSDVYGLGVLLYELLTGATPFDRQQLERAGIDEACRLIREKEPPRPSTKVSTLGDQVESVSQERQTDPMKLTQTLRGDLDWIVMTAMAKERNQRYETASTLGRDVVRYLSGEAITARPPTLIYRFSKFARRNRIAIATSVIILTVVALGLIVTLSSTIHAARTLKELRQEIVERGFVAAAAGDLEALDDAIERGQLADVAADQIMTLKAMRRYLLGDITLAINDLESVVKTHPGNINARLSLTVMYRLSYRMLDFIRSAHTFGALLEEKAIGVEDLTDYDLYYLGEAVAINRPREVSDWFETLFNRRRWPIARSTYFIFQARIALTQRDLDELSDALDQAAQTRPFLPDRSTRFLARDFALTVEGLRLAKELRDDSELWLEKAETFLSDLSDVDYPPAHQARAQFFHLTGEEGKALEAEERAIQLGLGGTDVKVARAFARSGEQAGLQRLYASGAAARDVARIEITLLALSHPERARDKYREFLERNDTTPIGRLIALLSFCAAGAKTEEVAFEARQLRESNEDRDNPWFVPICSYLSGESDLDLGEDRSMRMFANYVRAVNALQLGDERRAVALLQEVVDGYEPGWDVYEWSRAYLFQLSGDTRQRMPDSVDGELLSESYGVLSTGYDLK